MVGVASSLPVLLRHASMGPSVMMPEGCKLVVEGPTSEGEGVTVTEVLGSLPTSSEESVSSRAVLVQHTVQSIPSSQKFTTDNLIYAQKHITFIHEFPGGA